MFGDERQSRRVSWRVRLEGRTVGLGPRFWLPPHTRYRLSTANRGQRTTRSHVPRTWSTRVLAPKSTADTCPDPTSKSRSSLSHNRSPSYSLWTVIVMSLRLTLLRAPLLRPTPSLRPLPARLSLSLSLRRAYSDSKASEEPEDGKKKRRPPPPKPPLEPTTFDGKAAPRDVHNRPLSLRGMPATMSPWEMERQHSRPRSNTAGPRPAPRPKLDEHIFNESAAPRAIYQRPTRDLPKINVSEVERWKRILYLRPAGFEQ